ILVLKREPQVECFRIPLHRPRNDLAAQTEGLVVRLRALRQQLARRVEEHQVLADVAIYKIAEARQHDDQPQRESDLLLSAHLRSCPLDPPARTTCSALPRRRFSRRMSPPSTLHVIPSASHI